MLNLKKGSSTGFIPNHVKNKKMMTKLQKDKNFNSFGLFCCILGRKVKGRRIKIDINSPITPPNLFGIDRKIAYANRKYHSG
jgi:hypothetical protein